ncbi:phosphomevalonate kinase [Microbacterium sp. STN6]|uniref:phosphomevalonate kinase n=1 Tax=Microbacterium sp. STN6 TaxID=2995588 RepID=UPI002260B684|nr:phosphomevalonate kinase [Microbacterium sp. STN6]MCX7521888.1 phosphomevalonate kinase [Microbacterium sp. STN6]
MIRAEAPGKLFIAGEYAVVEPGEPSVLIAVDRCVTVELSETRERGSIASAQYGRLPVVWRREDDQVVLESDHRPFDYVLAAIRTVEQLVGELGIRPRFYDIRIESELDDVSGRKFGLGSSAAVTVATVRALNEFYALGLGDMRVFKLALLSTVQVSPSASGGDVAASTFGGWIAYRAPDRARLLESWRAEGVTALLDASWPHLEVHRLPPPATLRLLVGWTGQPASTERLVGGVQSRKWSDKRHYRGFLTDSRACVESLISALEAADAAAVMRSISRARSLLGTLGRNAGLDIETDALAALCDIAEAEGAVGKSSGAGGGDCGIVLAPPATDVHRMLREWEQHDIRHLSIDVHVAKEPIDEQ